MKQLLLNCIAITLTISLLACNSGAENSDNHPLIESGSNGRGGDIPVISVRINELMAANTESHLNPDQGNYDDWIELYNFGTETVDLTGYSLSDNPDEAPNKWVFPEGSQIAAEDYLVIWADARNIAGIELHTNFKLSQSGEKIAIVSADGNIVDSLEFPNQIANISYGRSVVSAAPAGFLDKPTPGQLNSTQLYDQAVQAIEPEFSIPAGIYSEPQTLIITADAPNTRVSITTDGSIPEDSTELSSNVSIEISKTTIVRARSFSDNALPGNILTQSYFMNEDTEIGILSLTTAPHHLYDSTHGIFAADAEHFNHKDWERPVNFEYFDENRNAVLNQQVALEMHGHVSRTYPIKNISVKTKGKYGSEYFDYEFFDRENKNPLQALIIRGTSVDQFKAYIRDPLIQSTIKGQMDLDYQDYHPVVMYINGEYQGIRYIRDRVNKDYLNTYHNLNPDDVIINSFSSDPNSSDITQFQEINDFVSTHNMAETENYAVLSSKIDIDSFINFLIIQIYSANLDTLQNNNKFWTNKSGSLPWRWFLFDLDLGFDECNVYGSNYNSVEYMLSDTENVIFPNLLNSTLLLRKLIDNSEFLALFTQRLASHLNITFTSDRVISLVNTISGSIEAEIPDHLARWTEDFNQPVTFISNCWTDDILSPVTTISDWHSEVERIREFTRVRPNFVKDHLLQKFGIEGSAQTSGWANLEITNPNPALGSIKVANVDLPLSELFSGTWLKDLPISIKANPRGDAKFVRWQGDVSSENPTITITLTSDTNIEAIFEAAL